MDASLSLITIFCQALIVRSSRSAYLSRSGRSPELVRVHPFGYSRSVVRLIYSRSDVVVRSVVVDGPSMATGSKWCKWSKWCRPSPRHPGRAYILRPSPRHPVRITTGTTAPEQQHTGHRITTGTRSQKTPQEGRTDPAGHGYTRSQEKPDRTPGELLFILIS